MPNATSVLSPMRTLVICDRHYPLQNPVVWNIFKHVALSSPGTITAVVVGGAANDHFYIIINFMFK